MDDPIISSPAAPVSVSRATPPKLVLISGGIIAAAIVLVGVLMVIPMGGISAWQRIVAQFELQGLLVADRSFTGIELQKFGFFGMKDYSETGIPGTLGDYDEAANTRVAILASEETGTQELWLLGKEPRLLTESGSAKASVAVSPDGSKIAYVARTDGAKEFSSRLSGWTVHMIDLETGIDAELGTGFAPQFFSRDGALWLLHTATSSMTVTNLESLQGFSTPIELPDRVEAAPRISPDGTHLALRSVATREYGLYRVYNVAIDTPLGIEPLEADLSGLMDLVFRGKTIYGVGAANNGMAPILLVTPEASVPDATIRTVSVSANQRLIP